MSVDNYSVLHIILQFVQFLIKTREPTPVSPLTSYILHPEGHPSSSPPPLLPPPPLEPPLLGVSGSLATMTETLSVYRDLRTPAVLEHPSAILDALRRMVIVYRALALAPWLALSVKFSRLLARLRHDGLVGFDCFCYHSVNCTASFFSFG